MRYTEPIDRIGGTDVVIAAVHTDTVREPAVFDEFLAAVCADRRTRVLSCTKPEDKRLRLCAGLALDACLKKVGLSAGAPVVRTAHGQPMLRRHPGWRFSLSHSGEYAVCVLDDAPVGIDIEQLRPVQALPLAKRFFTPDEAALLEAMPEQERQDAFFRLWTAKESVLKAQGLGLSGGLAAVPITYGDTLSAPEPWQLREYPLPGYAMTVCGVSDFCDAVFVISSCDSALLR